MPLPRKAGWSGRTYSRSGRSLPALQAVGANLGLSATGPKPRSTADGLAAGLPRDYSAVPAVASKAAPNTPEGQVHDEPDFTPTTYANSDRVVGPFYHGTAAQLAVGDLLVPGFGSNYHKGRIANHIYFSSMVAGLAAELASALTGAEGCGHVYLVEPTGPFEDDPNVTNKRFRGNPTKSYRSKSPLRVVAELANWPASEPGVVAAMLARLAALREQGLDGIED